MWWCSVRSGQRSLPPIPASTCGLRGDTGHKPGQHGPASWLPPSLQQGQRFVLLLTRGKALPLGRVKRAGEGSGKNKTKSKPSEVGTAWAGLGNDLCELYGIDKHLPSCFLNIPLLCKACCARKLWSLWGGRKDWVPQEPLPRSVLVQHSSAAFYIASGRSHSADFPTNEDVLHLGKAAWNENHIYFTTVVAGCPSLVYTDFRFM